MRFFLVCYDVSDDEVREDIARVLGQYGDRVQRSVFEVRLKGDRDWQELRQRLREAAGKEERDVRFYRLCERCRAASENLDGERVAYFPPTIIF